MHALFLFAVVARIVVPSAGAGLDPFEEDNECGASGNVSQCSLHALQRQTRRKVDLESNEGADIVASARDAYAAHSEEHGFSNHSSVMGARDGIQPPQTPMQYNGISWPEMVVSASPGAESHFFSIGDWGGMDGAMEKPPDDIPRMYNYKNGDKPGPHPFPRSRLGCNQAMLTRCYSGGGFCSHTCGFARGVDDKAQLLVAEQFKRRAAIKNPVLVLNVGDNFYWGGIAKECGWPMNQIHWATKHQFDSIYEGVYSGQGVDGKPWLSVLGNHDWGGQMFNAGWDQQIAYTWASNRWLMPAVYWHQRVRFPDYAVDIFMLDSNFHDAKPQGKDAGHNICGASDRTKDASCASAGGPKDLNDCMGWFQRLWTEQQDWVKQKLSESHAEWQIVVTHWPCDRSPQFWRDLHNHHGLDLLVTGHRHDQELWKANTRGLLGVSLGGLTCFITGGGGGISSEDSPLRGRLSHFWPNVKAQYGFFDLTISKTVIKLESIDYKGKTVDFTTVHPKA